MQAAQLHEGEHRLWIVTTTAGHTIRTWRTSKAAARKSVEQNGHTVLSIRPGTHRDSLLHTISHAPNCKRLQTFVDTGIALDDTARNERQ